MDTERLRYFTVIAETGSLTKASQMLGISHSGLSKAISALEAETKLKLFRPQGRGLEITQEGKWFYKKARDILQIAGEISYGPTSGPNIIRIGLSSVIAMTCSSLLSLELPESMSLCEIDVGEAEGKILAGELDFGIAFVPAPKSELEYLELGEVRFNAYAREDLLKGSDDLPFAVPTSDLPSNPLGYKNRDGWPIDVSRRSHYFVGGFAIALNLLRSGRAAVYMPDFVATLENEHLLNKFKIVKAERYKKAESKRKLFVVKRQSGEETKEMKKVAKVLRRTCCS